MVTTGLRRWLRDTRENTCRRIASHSMSDREYVSRLYRRQFGRAPNLDCPSGFNEKILVKILTDRRSYLTLFSDKLRVRDHVRKTAPELTFPALYWWSDEADGLPFAELPDAFALKANHGSGWNILVVSKARVRRADLVAVARKWLRSDFTIVGREWSYRNIRRAIYVEQLLRGEHGMPPPDYKLFVFSGKVRIIQVDVARFVRHTQVLYDRDWDVIDGTVAATPGVATSPPAALGTMITCAEAISLGVDFVRVDLYEVDGRVCFGELTSSPNKGLSPFRPAALDQRFGQYLHLDDYAGDDVVVEYPELVGEQPLLQSNAKAQRLCAD